MKFIIHVKCLAHKKDSINVSFSSLKCHLKYTTLGLAFKLLFTPCSVIGVYLSIHLRGHLLRAYCVPGTVVEAEVKQ